MTRAPEAGTWPVEHSLLPGRSRDEVGLAVRELVRGLEVAAAMGGRLLPLSPALDAVWLAVLAAPGGHERLPAVEVVDARAEGPVTGEDARRWLATYVSRFGPMDAAVVGYWPVARWLVRQGVDPTAVRA